LRGLIHRARAAFRARALRSSSVIAAKRAFALRFAAALPPRSSRHARINESDWNVFLGHAVATLAKFKMPEA
jgi:hypothetical protein